MNKLKLLRSCFLLIFVSAALHAQTSFNEIEKFDSDTSKFVTIGRGMIKAENGTLFTKNAFACFGERDWKNYKISFSARTAANEQQVQIWAGLRAYDRDDRYIFGFREGLQNNVYLSLKGYMGTDEFLALRDLDFHPEPGTWYDFRIEVCGSRIRIFLNDESKPRIDVTDSSSNLALSGPSTLGGSWIKTEFKNLSIESLPDDYLNNVDVAEYSKVPTQQEKEKQREVERKGYHFIKVDGLHGSRTRISLDGKWLFMPEYELSDETKAVSPTEGDIVNMEIPESQVFDGIAPMELRYFNNDQRAIPTVCHVALTTNRNPNVEELAEHIKIHGYINGDMESRSKYMQTIKGFPIIKISDNRSLLISTMSLEKATTDPIAGRLLSNIVTDMLGHYKKI